jgi:hypothetical protein
MLVILSLLFALDEPWACGASIQMSICHSRDKKVSLLVFAKLVAFFVFFDPFSESHSCALRKLDKTTRHKKSDTALRRRAFRQ